MDLTVIDTYAAGAGWLRQAISGLSTPQLHATPIPGKWSMQQLVVHVTDADLVMTDRMKRVIAEDEPALLAFDEEKWLARLQYSHQRAEEAAGLFEINRIVFTRVLRHLPDEAFSRVGIHSQRGRQTLADILTFSTTHLEHHLKFAHEKRNRLLATR
jgi:uncharacterized damage-inducible protein DinB